MKYLLTLGGKDVLSVIKTMVGESYALQLQKEINWTGRGGKYKMSKSASAACIIGIVHAHTFNGIFRWNTQKLFYNFRMCDVFVEFDAHWNRNYVQVSPSAFE